MNFISAMPSPALAGEVTRSSPETARAVPLPRGSARQNRKLTRRFILNLLSSLLLAGAVLMLGKACWIHVKAQVAQVLLERAFTQSVVSGEPVRGWSWADTWPVAKLKVQRLGEELIVLKGSSGSALAFGPGLMDETARLGERGTAVIAAHRDTHFPFLKDLQVGDEIAITRNDGLTFQYQVKATRVASWNKSGIDRNAPGFNLVLSTCYPFGGSARGDDRYLVEAVMVR